MAISCSLTTLDPQPTLTSAGTGQAIDDSDIMVLSAFIYAADTNTGAVYIGTSDATAKNGTGISLSAGNGINYTSEVNGIRVPFKLSSIFFDGATTGNKLVVQYFL